MTELVRGLIGSARRRPQDAGRSAPPIELPSLPVELRVPGNAVGWDVVADRLEGLLAQRMKDLGVHRDLDVRVSSTAGDTLDVAMDERPVALGIDPGLRGRPDRLVTVIDQRLRRRLSLLLGGAPDPVTAYVVDHGFAVPTGTSGSHDLDPWLDAGLADTDLSAEELGERELASRLPRLRLEVAEQTLRRAEPRPGAVPLLRKELFASKGIQFPDLEVVPTPDEPGTVRMAANDVHVGPYDLGADAGWADVVDQVLRPFVLHHASWFVSDVDIKRAFDELSFTLPDLSATFLECYPRRYMLTTCVRNFVREGRPVRNLPRILWLLVEIGAAGVVSELTSMSENPLLRDPTTPPGSQRDPAMLAARVRKCLAEESWRVGVRIMTDPVRIPTEVESGLLDAQDPAALAAAEWAAVEAAAGYGPTATVVTSSAYAVAPTHKALRALPHRLRVVAVQELPPDQVVGL